MNRRHSRRAFIGAALSGAAGLSVARTVPAARAQTRESRIDIRVDEPIGAIAPEIYGHFVEHLGGVVYDGIWVGEDSRVANVDGIRRALVDQLGVVLDAERIVLAQSKGRRYRSGRSSGFSPSGSG
jgi:alpha-N-arabinofuranosidase